MILQIPEFQEIVQLVKHDYIKKFDEHQIIAKCIDAKNKPILSLVIQEDCNIKWSFKESNKFVQSGEEILSYEGAKTINAELMGLWMSAHASFRAIQALDSQGGQVAASSINVMRNINENSGIDSIVDSLQGQMLEDGDIIVVADKAVAIAQGRVISKKILSELDPKFQNKSEREKLAKNIYEYSGHTMTSRQTMLIDYLNEEEISLGATNHNVLCKEISLLIYEKFGVKVDTVISDSDTGVDIGEPIIGIPTVGASPLGATAGLSFYETLRVTAVGELARGHNKGVPIVICKPSFRNKFRSNIGEGRNYQGSLHISLEKELHRGLKNTIYWEVN